MKKKPPQRPGSNPYPAGFVFGRAQAGPPVFSLAGLKLKYCLAALASARGEVLELGCGGGQYLQGLRRMRPDLALMGVDLDPAAVASAGLIPGAACIQADASALPFCDSRFSAVIGFDILEHVANPGQVLAEAHRVLAPGGVLHLYAPCEGNPGTVYQRRGHERKARWGGHLQQFTTRGLLEQLKGAGFSPRFVRHADYWLSQQLDYLFFQRLDASPHPEKLWAAQSLQPGGGAQGWLLRRARQIFSAATWLESVLRRGQCGSMGVHVTAEKR